MLSILKVLYLFLTHTIEIKINNNKNPHSIVLTVNGSQLIFSKDGDLIIETKRDLITDYRLSFQNCSNSMIQETQKVFTNNSNINIEQLEQLEQLEQEEGLCLELHD